MPYQVLHPTLLRSIDQNLDIVWPDTRSDTYAVEPGIRKHIESVLCWERGLHAGHVSPGLADLSDQDVHNDTFLLCFAPCSSYGICTCTK